jgi:RES domain-containing protein
MRLSACTRLARRPLHGVWYRAIAPVHWATALSTAHTVNVTSRFSPGKAADLQFEILYLAETPNVALCEFGAVYGPPNQHIANPRKSKVTILDVEVRLQAIADLTDPSQQDLLDVSVMELTGNWDELYPHKDAPTQRLGMALYATKRLEGFLVISAQMPYHKNLIVFPQKLIKGSELRYEDTITGKTHAIRP